GTIAATSASTRRVARHGWQKAVENCTNVARSPSPSPSSAAVTSTPSSSPGPALARFSTPLLRRSASPSAVPAARVTPRISKPSIAIGNAGPSGMIPLAVPYRLVVGSGRDPQQQVAFGSDQIDAADLVHRDGRGAG